MELLTGSVKKLYFGYLAAAFGSSLIASIYALVDAAMVGQYHGPDGAGALAVVAPVWNVIYSLGMLMGIGGSVLFSTIKGRGSANEREANEYFTGSVIGSAVLSVFVWGILILFDSELLAFFGASGNTLTLALTYIKPIEAVLPVFLFNQLLAAYLRNDNAPGLATAAVLGGGIFNVFGDYYFIFACDLGARGAGIATAMGTVVSLLIAIPHFFTKKNTLRLVKPSGLLKKEWEIIKTGFSTFFADIAMGILTVLFNRQIMKYLGGDALAVYAVIVNISTFAQCCGYSVGQAAQPVISTNLGAGNGARIRVALKYALQATAFFALVWTALSMLIPNVFIKIFMSPTPEVLAIAPAIFRSYGLSFLLLPFNIFSTFYFQALLKPNAAFIVSVGRGLVISGLLICLLPAALGVNALWFTMPITEALVALYAVSRMVRYTKDLELRGKCG